MSRQHHPVQEVQAMSSSTPKWLETVIEGYQKDGETKQLLAELSLSWYNDKGFTLTDGVIKYKGRI
jgi:hypothetical protein